MKYNERLFNPKKIRGRLHLARFYWLQKEVEKLDFSTVNVLELGCYDAKTLEFIDIPLLSYVGYDANWEGGIDIAKSKWHKNKSYQFIDCTQLQNFTPQKQKFDISICMETLEHLPLKELEDYIERLAFATKYYCFVTVPNEKGIILLIKYLIKRIIYRDVTEYYTLKELIAAFFGKTHLVKREEGGHKGFNYNDLRGLLEKYFTVNEVKGIPLYFLPPSLNFTVGMVLKKKNES